MPIISFYEHMETLGKYFVKPSDEEDLSEFIIFSLTYTGKIINYKSRK